jgi:glycosyltransferase involved in cell wall biosynthesis
MRIAWFTPFHEHSAIGEFSQHITTELAKLSDVEIWTSDDAPLLSTELSLVGYSPNSKSLDQLQDYDIVIYNLGNYLGYHGDIHLVSKEHPGIVILHDRAFHHLFADMWLMGEGPDPTYYIERMGLYYGVEGADLARESLQGKRRPVWESDEEILRYPLYEEGIMNALGVVTHSEGQARDVRAGCLGPVASLRLPCYTDILARVSETFHATPDERLRLLTIGHLNPNKQVHRVIEMLVVDPELAAKVEYRVVGSDGGFTAYSKSLHRLIAQNADNLHVEILDWLPDSELEDEMQRADVFVNLRYPNIEGSSASLMKQFAYGRPVLCFDSGTFGEMPEGVVVRVPTGDFRAAGTALHELIASTSRRREVGERARTFAESCNERSYVDGLMILIDEARKASQALQFLDSVALELGNMNVDGRLPIFHDIANDFARILAL